MKLNHFTQILRSIQELTSNQLHLVQHRINEQVSKGVTSLMIDKRKGGDISCQHCHCEVVEKWDSASGLQRYKCKECGKTFNALTKTSLARLRKHHLWQTNLDCMFDALPLWLVSEELNVATTAFRWRHRFLDAPTKAKPSDVAGIIEADKGLSSKYTKAIKLSKQSIKKARRFG